MRTQEEIEIDLISSKTSIYMNNLSETVQKGRGGEAPEMDILTKLTIEAYTDKIKEYLGSSIRGRKGATQTLLEPWRDREEVVALTTIRAILNMVAKGTDGATAISNAISRELSILLSIERVIASDPNLYAYVHNINDKMPRSYIRKAKQQLAKARKVSEGTLGINVGATLLEILVKSGANLITIPTIRRSKVVVLTPEAEAIIANMREGLIGNSITYKPLVSPPTPHTSWVTKGGHQIIDSIPLVKFKNRRDFKFIQTQEFPSRLVEVLNRVSMTRWAINTRVLEVIEHIVDNHIIDNNSTPDYPFLVGGLPIVDIKSPYDVYPKHLAEGYDSNTEEFTDTKYLAQWLHKIKEEERKVSASTSKRITLLLTLNIAREFKDYKDLYFSYTLDFRGRVYALQGILNPQGQGYTKSLLRFSRGVPYTDRAKYWMKVHLANTLGYDKLTLDERVAKVEELEGEIIEISKDPIRNTHLWKEADSPYLYLSGAIDYGDYLTGNSSFCYTPISLDATCSGIQIYSGLLLDEEGAKAVNVINGDTKYPNDIYQQVIDVVIGYIKAGDYDKTIVYTTADKEEHSISVRDVVATMADNLTRKHSKRNVMTTPYSVTKRGMFNQLKEQLESEEQSGKKWWAGEAWVVAKILTSLNSRAINEVVKGAIVGQEYLKSLATSTNALNKPILYHTPIFEFPVYQNVKKVNETRVTTPIGKLVYLKQTNKVHKARQLSGIAPNIIHSLDSTLMMLTCEKLLTDGVTDFMLIHDDYGVPATEVDKLNTRVREAYIELFSSEPLAKITKEITGGEVPEGVMINTLNLDDVTKSNFIFS